MIFGWRGYISDCYNPCTNKYSLMTMMRRRLRGWASDKWRPSDNICKKNCNKIIIRMRRRSVSNKGSWASVRQLERRIRRNMNLPPNAPAASILRQLRFLIFYSFFCFFMTFFCFFIPFFCFLRAMSFFFIAFWFTFLLFDIKVYLCILQIVETIEIFLQKLLN